MSEKQDLYCNIEYERVINYAMEHVVLKKGKKGATIKKKLNNNYACSVLITCSRPTVTGDMNVELSYEGDDVLATYLVENASEILNQNMLKSME